MQAASIPGSWLVTTVPYFPLGSFATTLTQQVDCNCKVPGTQALPAAQAANSHLQHRRQNNGCSKSRSDVSQKMSVALPPVLTVASHSSNPPTTTLDPQAVSTPGSADSSSTANQTNLAAHGIKSTQCHPAVGQDQLRSVLGEVREGSGPGVLEQSGCAGQGGDGPPVCAPQQLLQRLHGAQGSAESAADQVIAVAADHQHLGNRSETASVLAAAAEAEAGADHDDGHQSMGQHNISRTAAATAAAARADQQQSGQQQLGTSLADEKSAAKLQEMAALADGSHHVKPQVAACDTDALEAAAQLLLLHSAAAEHQGYSSIAAAGAGSAGAQAVDVHHPQPHAAGISDAVAVSADCQHLNGKVAPPDQQELPEDLLLTVDSTAQQQKQDDDSKLALGLPVQERRSKRSRKTSYKAAMAAESEGALTEYLQRAAGRSRGSCNATHGSASFTPIADVHRHGDQAVLHSLEAAQEHNATKHRRARKLIHQQIADDFVSDQAASHYQQCIDRATAAADGKTSHRQQQQQHIESPSASGGSAVAGSRCRSVHQSKRCVVRTSMMPVGTAVQQKLQHVVSFFPEMHLPGVRPVIEQQQPGDTSAAAAEAAIDYAQALLPPHTWTKGAALSCEGARNMQMDNDSAEQLEQQQQLGGDSYSTLSSDLPASPTAMTAGAAVAVDHEVAVQQQQQQQQSGSVSEVIARPRRKRKPITRRYSPPPLPPSATVAVKQERSRSHTDHQQQRQLPPRKKQHVVQPDMTAAASADQQPPSTQTCPIAAAAADAAVGRNAAGSRNKGGRPRGSGNKHQMAPRSVDRSGKTGFALRSAKYTGVYQSRRAHEGWRAQFCFSNKVLNLGTYATEDDAARAWNAAAQFFRGNQAWMNPVQPRLPEDFVPGSLGKSVPAATVTAAAEAAARAKQ